MIIENFKECYKKLTTSNMFKNKEEHRLYSNNALKYLEELSLFEFAVLGKKSNLTHNTKKEILDYYLKLFSNKFMTIIEEEVREKSLQDIYDYLVVLTADTIAVSLFAETLIKNSITQLIISFFLLKENEEIISFCKNEDVIIRNNILTYLNDAKQFYQTNITRIPYLCISPKILFKL